MSDKDIFALADQRPRGEFFTFKNVGDKVQGTYVDCFCSTNRFGGRQAVVVLQDGEKVHNIGILKTSTVLIDQVKKARFGQILGFRFDAITPSKSVPGKMANIINCVQDPEIVDEEWIKNHPKMAARNPITIINEEDAIPSAAAPVYVSQNTSVGAPTYSAQSAPVAAQPFTPAVPVAAAGMSQNKLDALRNLAKAQGLTNETMTAEQQDATITAYSEFALTDQNVALIIGKLTNYKA